MQASLAAGTVEIRRPDGSTVVLPYGAIPHVPDQVCPAQRIYRSHIRLEGDGVGGTTFGVAESGFLDWIPPTNAGCVDWSTVDASVTFPKEVIMQFRLLRLLPGALLWVQDGDAQSYGRLYEVGIDGLAHYVSGDVLTAGQAHFRETWKNVIPVSWRQIQDLTTRGLIGASL